jgi:hypothetical protein
MQSSLSCDRAGTLYAALMIEPTSDPIWGPNGTRIVCLRIHPSHPEIAVEPICEPDETVAQWLPAQEQPGWVPLDHTPALLYTRGTNAGGFELNKNETATQVWLICRDGDSDCRSPQCVLESGTVVQRLYRPRIERRSQS